MEQDQDQNFRHYLQSELTKRCQVNRSYSLRSFATHLKIDASSLSKILAGKRKLTSSMISRLGHSLNLSPVVIEQFVLSELNRDDTTKEPNYKILAQDTFELISNWYYYAILELMYVQTFEPSFKWISTALGITLTETKIAMERLERLSFVEKTGEGWKLTTGQLTNVGAEYTTSAFKSFQKQVFSKAIESLEADPLELRDHSSVTVAIDPQHLPKIKDKIKAFRRSLCDGTDATKKPTQVYQLGISFFPLTHLPEKEGTTDEN